MKRGFSFRARAQVDSIPLSRPKKNISRDFSDGGESSFALPSESGPLFSTPFAPWPSRPPGPPLPFSRLSARFSSDSSPPPESPHCLSLSLASPPLSAPRRDCVPCGSESHRAPQLLPCQLGPAEAGQLGDAQRQGVPEDGVRHPEGRRGRLRGLAQGGDREGATLRPAQAAGLQATRGGPRGGASLEMEMGMGWRWDGMGCSLVWVRAFRRSASLARSMPSIYRSAPPSLLFSSFRIPNPPFILGSPR